MSSLTIGAGADQQPELDSKVELLGNCLLLCHLAYPVSFCTMLENIQRRLVFEYLYPIQTIRSIILKLVAV